MRRRGCRSLRGRQLAAFPLQHALALQLPVRGEDVAGARDRAPVAIIGGTMRGLAAPAVSVAGRAV